MKEIFVNVGLGGGRLLQIANRTSKQMMGYLVECPDGKLIMIDGGNSFAEEAENLYEMIRQRGGRVELWLFTHAHCDHNGTFNYLLENREKYPIEIGEVAFSFPRREWLEVREDWDENSRFFALLESRALKVHTLTEGEVISCHGIDIKIISVPRDYEGYARINPTSVIMKLAFPKREVLFLADFDQNAEEEFYRYHSKDELKCDIVQMAHHGQGGVSEEFYSHISPKICLYPAPRWLWENNLYRCDDPATVGKGPFTTLQTREWMERLGAEASYSQADGDVWLF